jgi:hypothetical protein
LKVKYHKQCYEKKMCKRFPQLVFHRPKLWKKSEIVYAEYLSQAKCSIKLYGWWHNNFSEFTRVWFWCLHWNESIHVHKCNIEINDNTQVQHWKIPIREHISHKIDSISSHKIDRICPIYFYNKPPILPDCEANIARLALFAQQTGGGGGGGGCRPLRPWYFS